jgi:hypothetical protein
MKIAKINSTLPNPENSDPKPKPAKNKCKMQRKIALIPNSLTPPSQTLVSRK